MKKVNFVLLSIVVLSCNSNLIDRETQLDRKAGSVKLNSSVNIIKDNTKEKSSGDQKNNSINNLIGLWTLSGSKNVIFQIDKKSFYYPEHSISYKYIVIGDSIKVHYDGFDQSFAFKFDGNNVLYLSGEDGNFKYKRIKK